MKIHLIGIGGTGMGSLAGLLKAAGHDVRGSDTALYPPMSTQLAEQHIPVMEGFAASNLDWAPERVVVGNVCSKDHVEVIAAQARDLPLTSFPALLEEMFLLRAHSLVIAGTHGKTTTSSLASFVLAQAGVDPSFLVGGVPLDWGRGWRLGYPFRPHSERPLVGPAAGAFIVEGDEYDTAFFDKGSKFFHYAPKTAILTSVELDHIDIFDSLDAVHRSFEKFVALIPREGLLVVCAESPGAIEVSKHARCRVVSYAVDGSGVEADWIARVITTRPGGRTLFELVGKTEKVGPFDFGLSGTHNLANAAAVAIAALDLGVPSDKLAIGLRRFAGVKRRQEVVGVAQGVTVIDDFAHHPTAVRETLRGLRGRHGQGRLIAVYEPRSATSRRARFQADFADAFTRADELIVGAVDHPEKAPDGDRFDPERLAADVRDQGITARYLPEIDKILDHLTSSVTAGDTVVIMSSGGFGNIHQRLLQRLGDAVVPARASDVEAVATLLQRVELPYPDLADHVGDLFVVRGDEGEPPIASCVALESFGDAGVLRALATTAERRGEGLGWMMADSALRRARSLGLRRVFLVTESASDFFAEKFGFRLVPIDAVDEVVLVSSQFKALNDRSKAMQLDLE